MGVQPQRTEGRAEALGALATTLQDGIWPRRGRVRDSRPCAFMSLGALCLNLESRPACCLGWWVVQGPVDPQNGLAGPPPCICSTSPCSGTALGLEISEAASPQQPRWHISQFPFHFVKSLFLTRVPRALWALDELWDGWAGMVWVRLCAFSGRGPVVSLQTLRSMRYPKSLLGPLLAVLRDLPSEPLSPLLVCGVRA